MRCEEVRWLLEHGGARGRAEKQALHAHLEACPACQALRRAHADALLAGLLTAPAAQPPDQAVLTDLLLTPPALGAAPRLRLARAARHSRRSALRAAVIGLAMLAAVAVAIPVGQAALALLAIHRNVQAMIVAPAAPPTPPPATEPPATEPAQLAQAILPTAAPTARLPTALPTSAPAQPTAQPTRPAATAFSTAAPPTPQIAGPVATLTATPELLPNIAAPPEPPPGTPAPARPADSVGSAPLVRVPDGQAVTVLLLGSDLRPDERGNARADAIMIARIEPGRQRVALLSLPRDLVVPIPGYGQARINAANAWGGPELARRTVSGLLDIPIDYYALVNFEGFVAVIDALDGITVNVDKEIYDPLYPTMDYGYQVAHFLPGPQQMNGARALMYGRVRHPDSDYERIKRQQAVVLGIVDRVRDQNALESLQSLAAVTGALRGYVQTDMPEEQMISLAWSLRGIEPSAVERYSLGAHMVAENVLEDDPYAEFALPGAIETLARQLVGE